MHVWCMSLLMSVAVVCCKKCGCQWHLFCQCTVIEFRVKEKQLKWSKCYVYALVSALSDGGLHEVEMNMTYVPEHVKTWYMLQIQWFIIWLMMKIMIMIHVLFCGHKGCSLPEVTVTSFSATSILRLCKAVRVQFSYPYQNVGKTSELYIFKIVSILTFLKIVFLIRGLFFFSTSDGLYKKDKLT